MTHPHDSGSQVRWLVVGPFTPQPTGGRHLLTAAEFPEWLESLQLTCDVSLPSWLVAEPRDPLTLSVDKVRALTLKEVTKRRSLLQGLLEVAARVRDPQEALRDVEQLVGPGGFLDGLAAMVAEQTAPAQPTEAQGKDIFEQAEIPSEESGAARAVNAFLRGVRTPLARPRKSKVERLLRDALEQAVYVAARDMLCSAPLTDLEASLRGLQFFVQQCPRDAGMRVEVLDLPMDQVAEALRERGSTDFGDEPDAVFVPFAVRDLAVLRELAEVGEALLCPVIVGIDPGLLGQANARALADFLQDIKPSAVDAGWLALRQEESSRWLCGVVNDVVLLAEGVGEAARVVLGSGVWALAAGMAKSYREVGSFARIAGQPGSIAAPGVHTDPDGPSGETATPTEVFLAIRHQGLLAQHGLLALGSSRNSDKVVLAQVPTVRAAADAVPLPAQLLTGRLVRFAEWVRDQLPPHAPQDLVDNVFREAAEVFLFPGMAQIGQVTARVIEEEGQPRSLRVHAAVHPAYAGLPFEIDFDLSCA